MLREIIAVRNVGRFRNSAAAGNPQLARHTLISGADGFGKTTLCAILRSLQSGDPAHVLGHATPSDRYWVVSRLSAFSRKPKLAACPLSAVSVKQARFEL